MVFQYAVAIALHQVAGACLVVVVQHGVAVGAVDIDGITPVTHVYTPSQLTSDETRRHRAELSKTP